MLAGQILGIRNRQAKLAYTRGSCQQTSMRNAPLKDTSAQGIFHTFVTYYISQLHCFVNYRLQNYNFFLTYAKKMRKNLHVSKKSSTFARFFV